MSGCKKQDFVKQNQIKIKWISAFCFIILESWYCFTVTVFIGSITATYFLAITESSALKTPREKLTVVWKLCLSHGQCCIWTAWLCHKIRYKTVFLTTSSSCFNAVVLWWPQWRPVFLFSNFQRSFPSVLYIVYPPFLDIFLLSLPSPLSHFMCSPHFFALYILFLCPQLWP